MNSGLYITAGPLLGIAKTAYERTKKASSDLAPDQTDALVAIVFAAAALETFMNEVAKLAALPPTPGGPPEPASVDSLAGVLEEIEKSRGTLELKFLLTSAVLAGEPYDKGAQPYQDFALLVDLRNHLVHLKPREQFSWDPETGMSVKPPSIVERLQSKGILAEFEAEDNAQFILWVSTRAAARWACNTAAEMVQSVLNAAPTSHFKQKLQFFYAGQFQLVG